MTFPRAVADTSVWIAPPAGGFVRYTEEVSVIVTVAELEYGAQTTDPVQSLARRRRLRAIVVDHFDVLTLDLPGAELYGTLAELVRGSGRNPRPRRFDLLIAAIAARHDLPLLTRDLEGFSGLHRVVQVAAVE